uniref:Uncharacterized protein n=2 Tax=Arion vulgaris TaxID=1028688 RepID=A0A0B6ZNJ7_9EUPU
MYIKVGSSLRCTTVHCCSFVGRSVSGTTKSTTKSTSVRDMIPCGLIVPVRYISICIKQCVNNYRMICGIGSDLLHCRNSFDTLLTSISMKPHFPPPSLYSSSSRAMLVAPHINVHSVLNRNDSLQVKYGRFHSTHTETNENPDFESIAKIVVEAAKKNNVMAGSVPLVKVGTLLKKLHSQGFLRDQCMEVLAKRLHLLDEPESLSQLTESLLLHGLKHEVVIDILNHIPFNDNISFANVQLLIEESLQHLRIMGFTERDVTTFLTSDSRILLTNSATRTLVFANLKGLFTTEDALHVLKKCPNVLSDPWRETNEKFDYAYFTMGYKQRNILKTQLFQHSLHHTQDRHIFLVRAGLFVYVKEKDDPKLNPNPALHDVIDTTNKYFATYLGNISLEEYNTYLKMREIEREEEEEFSDESDDEEEDKQHSLKQFKKRKEKKK